MALTDQERKGIYAGLEFQIDRLLKMAGQLQSGNSMGDEVNFTTSGNFLIDGNITGPERDYVQTVLGISIPKGDLTEPNTLEALRKVLDAKQQQLELQTAKGPQGGAENQATRQAALAEKARVEARQAARDERSGEFDREIPYGVTPQIQVDRPWLEPGLSDEEYQRRARAAENDPATDLAALIEAERRRQEQFSSYGPQPAPIPVRPGLPEIPAGVDAQQAMALLLHYARMGNDLTGHDVPFKPSPDEMELFSMGLVGMEPGEALLQLRENLNETYGSYDAAIKANIEFDLKKLGGSGLSPEERNGILDRLEQVQKLMGPDFIAKLDIEDGTGRDLPRGGLEKGLLQGRFGAAADGSSVSAAPMPSSGPAPYQQPGGPQ